MELRFYCFCRSCSRSVIGSVSDTLVERLLPRGAARGRGRINRSVAGLDANIDNRDAAALDHADRVAQGAHQFVGPADRAKSLRALRLGQHAEIGFGIGNALADPAVRDRTVALPR